MDYKSTINLPVTDFPMKGNLQQREPAMVERWQSTDLYGQLQTRAQGRPRFVLHDGPPYANGDIHLGTALNKVLKDFVVKFKQLAGFQAPYVPGWDCHGLPIELKTMEENKGLTDPATIRKRCREYAQRFIDKQRTDFIRLGVLGDWQNPYLTMSATYEATQLDVFATLVERGLVFRELKPIHWCPRCETALAEAEIEYEDHASPSVFVRFEARKETLPGEFAAVAGPVYFVIWTTTPWTLPGNVAIAFHPEHAYALYEVAGVAYVVAKELASKFASRAGLALGEPLAELPGKRLEGLACRHPFLDRDSVAVLADFVSLDDGTGIVHTAPGHGDEDYHVGLRYKLPILSPIDSRGHLTHEAGPFAGLFYEKANGRIREHLAQSGALLASEEIQHSYPHCWRCKKAVIFRASPQWFVGIDRGKSTVRQRALDEIQNVRWIPPVGIKRIGGMLENRPDWCISRQRIWGVPIPVFYCQDCERETLEPAIVRHVAAIVRAEGGEAWVEKPAEELLPPQARCAHCGSRRLRKEKDIMDVWLDSGVSHAAVLTTRQELAWPADLYLEGSDQHRGWFQTSLLTSIGYRDQAPYRQVLTHGFVVDEEGRKMSKSLGNVIVPQEIAKDLGCEILRLWVASADYTTDIKVSKNILGQCTDMYRRIRNTLRFMLGNTSDFDPAADHVPHAELEEMDRWALALLAQTLEQASQHYEQYRFYMVLHLLHNLCAVELSAFYLDILKDRLYCSHKRDKVRRSAQTALWEWCRGLVTMLAPIASFTSEEAFGHMNWDGERPASVFLTDWPNADESWKDPMLLARWERISAFKRAASKALEAAREKKVIGSSLEARLSVYVPDDALRLDIDRNRKLYEEVCIVSRLALADAADQMTHDVRLAAPESSEFLPGVLFGVTEASGTRCERCWKHLKDVGQNAGHPGLCARCADVVTRIQG
ncbi:MAG: isoleucine--tRNA ligase [Candidatus Wallbacteria bacterium]|nr:isoleucine--tRNA ligase [Candidatus Wallbacteria bacterium]